MTASHSKDRFLSLREGLTFDDVLLVPAESDILPQQADVSTYLTRTIKLNIPIISAAMDTVTESEMAIGMAKEGGLGIIHKNMSIERQAEEVRKTKRTRIEAQNFPNSVLDERGLLRAGAAIGVSEDVADRVSALVEADVDILVLDSAHGHTKGVLETIKKVKKMYPDIPFMGGNIGTSEGAKALIDAGVDAVKVGVGSGASCTTRVVAGIGVPQLTAVMDVFEVSEKANIPVISDGGMRYSGDIAKSVAAGASCVMLGRLLAGVDESPGETIILDNKKYVQYRGMGSLGPMQERSADRYFQEKQEKKKLVPEGIEGAVPYQGSLNEVLFQLIGGLRAAMGYCGVQNIEEMKRKVKFIKVSRAGVVESHPHDVKILKEAPNYRVTGLREKER